MLQRTPEWFTARIGKVTASCIHKVMAEGRGKAESIVRANYRAEKVLEHLYGISAENDYQSAAMLRGTELEDAARSAYASERLVVIKEAPFVPCPLPGLELAGASPDGFIGEHGLLEVKCPEARGYLDFKLGKPLKREYELQVQWQLACTGRQWCDFVVFREGLPILNRRILRDDALINQIVGHVRAFLLEVAAELEEASK